MPRDADGPESSRVGLPCLGDGHAYALVAWERTFKIENLDRAFQHSSLALNLRLMPDKIELEKALDTVVAGPSFTAAELPVPKSEERKTPGTVSAAGLLGMMGMDEEQGDDDE
jgi:hypothetical protein